MTSQDGHTHKADPGVGIVVLNFNGRDVLPGLLDSLTGIAYPNFKIFLVDNASPDGSADIAEAYTDRLPLEIIRNSENLLFSKGNNVGIKRAMEWGADYVFLLNNDTVVPPELVAQLVRFLEDKSGAGIAGPMIHFGTPDGVIWGAGGEISTWWGLTRHRGIREQDRGQFSEAAKVDYVSGAAFLVRRTVIEKIGMLNESLPMYYEDTDFCFRARKAGYETWYVPTEPLIHLVSVAAGGQLSINKIRRRFVSGMKFFAVHAKWYQWPTIILGQIYESVRVLAGVVMRKF